jgi:hypothetical protein
MTTRQSAATKRQPNILLTSARQHVAMGAPVAVGLADGQHSS